jgi:hypothetical protein
MYQSAPDPIPPASSPIAVDEHETAESDLGVPARGFLAELTLAMQAVAENQREATASEVEAMTRAHLERVRARAAAEAAELRRMSDGDIDGIRSWQQAEAMRIQEEADRRIQERGAELDSYLMRHAAIVDGEVGHIESAVATYQTSLDEYFDRLTTETSPTEIARLADEIPDPPDLGKVASDARVQAVATLAAESDVAADAGPPRGPTLVPVMASADEIAEATAGASTGPTWSRHEVLSDDAATADGAGDAPIAVGAAAADGAVQDHTNPAIRILRSIASIGASTEHAAHAPATTESMDETRV